MKKLIAGLVALGVAASPAMAAKTTIEFKRDTGEVNVVTLDGAGGATLADGTAFSYNYDAETNTMCFVTGPEETTCIVFAEAVPEPKVGDNVRYKADDGGEGTATVMKVEE